MEVFTLPRKAENRLDLSFQPSSVKHVKQLSMINFLQFTFKSETNRNKTRKEKG